MNEPRTSREALIAEMLGDIDKIYIKLEAIYKKIESTNQSSDLATKRFLDASQAYEANARKAVQTLTAFSANQVFNETLLPNFKVELKTFIEDELREFTKQLKRRSSSFEESKINSAYASFFFWACFALVGTCTVITGMFIYLNLFAK